jgi:hypothetical protein
MNSQSKRGPESDSFGWDPAKGPTKGGEFLEQLGN